jgi:hypothetical protein
MNQMRHSSIPGDTRIEPREENAPADEFLAGVVLVIAAAGATVGAFVGALVALVYESFDPVGVGVLYMVLSGAIVGSVAGGLVAARQIVGRFDQK